MNCPLCSNPIDPAQIPAGAWVPGDTVISWRQGHAHFDCAREHWRSQQVVVTDRIVVIPARVPVI